MKQQLTIHIIDREPRSRAALAHQLFALGHHAEVYETLGELLARPPRSGLIMARDDQSRSSGMGGTTAVLAQMAEVGVWLPVVAISAEREVDAVLAAMKAGALDFFLLPMEEVELGEAIASIRVEADRRARRQKKVMEARRALDRLSQREGQVLQYLAQGCSNKEIARELEISPRTVEIHRANMMLKLSAGHPSDAVRLRFEAALEDDGPVPAGSVALGSATAQSPGAATQ